MAEWFKVGISYEKSMEDGKIKKVKELFLVDAVSVTEAEARLIQEVTPLMNGEFKVNGVNEENITELFKNKNGGYWFKVKVSMTIIDEFGKEKTSRYVMCVQCEDIRNVLSRLDECLKDSMSDYVVNSIVETKYLDVFEYKPLN
jgi:hypothetical protein